MVIRNWRRRLIAAAFLMLFGGLLEGCGGTSTPSAKELDAIRGGKETLVLLRLACGEPQNEHPGFLASEDGQDLYTRYLGLGYVDVDRGGKPHRFRDYDYRALSKSATGEGWFALIEPPGYHYLTFGFQFIGPGRFVGFIPPTDDWKFTTGEPNWRVEVPSGTPAIYLGTFRDVACGPTPQHTFQVDFGKPASLLHVEDEREKAALVVHRDLPTLPPPTTRLAVLQVGSPLRGLPPSEPTQ